MKSKYIKESVGWLPLRSAVTSCLFGIGLMAAFITPQAHAAFGDRIAVSGSQFSAGGTRIWLNGANTPWNGWNDFGGSFDATWWTSHFQSLKDNKINCTRVWITCNGEVGININAAGVVSGATTDHWEDLDSLFSIAASKGVYIMATLVSFDHTKNNHPNYQRWRNMLNSSSNTDTFVNNYVVPFVNRYKTNNYLWSIDLMNEPDWSYENAESGNMSWSVLQRYFAKAAVAIHANSNILVTVGIAMGPKYNSETLGTNVVSDSALQAQVADSRAKLDFWSSHHYDWMSDVWSNPFYGSPSSYGLNSSKPAIIGECPAVGTSGHTTAQDYENAYVNGWQGAQAWTSNGVDSMGGMPQLAPATIAFYNNHPTLVYPSAATSPVYTFESSTQNWGVKWGTSSVNTSTVQHQGSGTKSLRLNFSNSADAGIGIDAPSPSPAGKTITIWVWVPNQTALNGLFGFVQYGSGWTWTQGTTKTNAQLTKNAWNSITVAAPAGQTIQRIGLGYDFVSTYTGTFYIDSVTY